MLDRNNPVNFIPIPLLFALHFSFGIANRPELVVILDCIPGTCYYFLLHRWFSLQGCGHGDYLAGDEEMKWRNFREVNSTFQSIYLEIQKINFCQVGSLFQIDLGWQRYHRRKVSEPKWLLKQINYFGIAYTKHMQRFVYRKIALH